MKPNIDLTNNRMFQDDIDFTTILIKHLVGKIPWKNVYSLSETIKTDSDLEYNYTSSLIPISKQLFPLGNKQERNKTKDINNSISEHYCDRCGKHIHTIPWKFSCSLCETCFTELKLDLKIQWKDKYPWKSQKTMTADENKTDIFIL